jgi:hypothetical protein
MVLSDFFPVSKSQPIQKEHIHLLMAMIKERVIKLKQYQFPRPLYSAGVPQQPNSTTCPVIPSFATGASDQNIQDAFEYLLTEAITSPQAEYKTVFTFLPYEDLLVGGFTVNQSQRKYCWDISFATTAGYEDKNIIFSIKEACLYYMSNGSWIKDNNTIPIILGDKILIRILNEVNHIISNVRIAQKAIVPAETFTIRDEFPSTGTSDYKPATIFFADVLDFAHYIKNDLSININGTDFGAINSDLGIYFTHIGGKPDLEVPRVYRYFFPVDFCQAIQGDEAISTGKTFSTFTVPTNSFLFDSITFERFVGDTPLNSITANYLFNYTGTSTFDWISTDYFLSVLDMNSFFYEQSQTLQTIGYIIYKLNGQTSQQRTIITADVLNFLYFILKNIHTFDVERFVNKSIFGASSLSCTSTTHVFTMITSYTHDSSAVPTSSIVCFHFDEQSETGGINLDSTSTLPRGTITVDIESTRGLWGSVTTVVNDISALVGWGFLIISIEDLLIWK